MILRNHFLFCFVSDNIVHRYILQHMTECMCSSISDLWTIGVIRKLKLFLFVSANLALASDGPIFIKPNDAPIAIQPAATKQGNYVTQTVYGFLDFTTTIGNTVMVFSPQSAETAVPGNHHNYCINVWNFIRLTFTPWKTELFSVALTNVWGVFNAFI